MNTRGIVLTMALAAAFSPAAQARSSAYKVHQQQKSTREQAERSVAHMQNVLSKPYFSPDLVLSKQARNVAMATHKLGFVKAAKDKVFVCRYDYLAGKIDLTKYEKYGKDLRAVKTESYTYAFYDTLKCTRKTKDARKSSPIGEGVARVILATTSPEDIKFTSVADLYRESMPMWIQADSASDLEALMTCLQEDLADQMINPLAIDDVAKPVVVFSVKNDLFLDTFDEALWSELKQTFNVTTFLDKELREFVWKTRDSIVDARKEAKAAGFDTNPSLLEGLFSDIEKDSAYFNTKLMIRQTVKGVWENVLKWGVPALVTVGIFYTARGIIRSLLDSELKEAWDAKVNKDALTSANDETSRDAYIKAAYEKGYKNKGWYA